MFYKVLTIIKITNFLLTLHHNKVHKRSSHYLHCAKKKKKNEIISTIKKAVNK